MLRNLSQQLPEHYNINDLLTESSKTDKEWLRDNQKFDLTINKHYNW